MLHKTLTLFARKISLHSSPILAITIFTFAGFFSSFSFASAFVVGINVNQFLGHFDAGGQAATKEAGTHSIRIGYEHGDHDAGVAWAAQNGVGVLFFLGYGEGCNPRTPAGRQCYADRSAGLAKKYGNKVQYYEVWNEWNIGLGHGGPGACSTNQAGTICADTAAYTDLLCRTYRAVKAVAPNAKVVGSVSAGTDLTFNGRILDAGGGKCMDAISIHPYVYLAHPVYTVAPGASGAVAADMFIKAVTAVDTLVRQKIGRSLPILVTEEGRYNGSNPQVSADFITQIYNRSKSLSFMEGIWYYALVETGPNRYGLIRRDHTKLPPFFAFQSAAKGIPNTGLSPTGPPLPPPPPPGPHVTLTVTPACFP